MTFEEIKQLKESGDAPFKIKSRSLFRDGYINVNHSIPIQVDVTASFFDKSSDVSIYSPAGAEIGTLCFTKNLGNQNWRSLTENQFIAFLSEASYANREEDYKFDYDYLIIHDSFYEEYINNYMDTSSIWGGFNHTLSNPMLSHKISINRIDIQELDVPKEIYKENARRSVLQPFGHERFLKLYHLLELRFDLDVIEEIKGLDIETEPEKIGKIFTQYSKTEFPRLKSIIESNCTDIDPLVLRLNEIRHFASIANQMFYTFGKDSNPFKDDTKFNQVVPFGFDENALRKNSVNFQGNHPKFITSLTSYWIYRIRCSIAHNKIGEYIISQSEENFLVEFAEPLIKEVIKQCFKR